MDKVIKNLNLSRQFQNIILGFIGLLAILYGVFPDPDGARSVLLIGVMIGIPTSLVIMGFTLKVFRDVAKLDPTFKGMAIWAGLFSIGAGAYTLGLWILLVRWIIPISDWSSVSAAFVGLMVLFSHMYMTKVALAKLRKTTAA